MHEELDAVLRAGLARIRRTLQTECHVRSRCVVPDLKHALFFRHRAGKAIHQRQTLRRPLPFGSINLAVHYRRLFEHWRRECRTPVVLLASR